jgi:hypothetical protein
MFIYKNNSNQVDAEKVDVETIQGQLCFSEKS